MAKGFGYIYASHSPRSSEREPHDQMQFSVIPGTFPPFSGGGGTEESHSFAEDIVSVFILSCLFGVLSSNFKDQYVKEKFKIVDG